MKRRDEVMQEEGTRREEEARECKDRRRQERMIGRCKRTTEGKARREGEEKRAG